MSFFRRHPYVIAYVIVCFAFVIALGQAQRLSARQGEDNRAQIERICQSSAETRAAVRQLVQFATAPAATTPEDDAADRERIRIANERRQEFRAAAENIIGDPDCLEDQ